MEAKTAFVRPDCAVELHTITAIGLHAACVVHPRHPKRNRPFRLRHTFQQPEFFILRMLVHHRFQRRIYFFHRLQKFRFPCVFLLDIFQYPLNIGVHACPPDVLNLIGNVGIRSRSSYSRGQAKSTNLAQYMK
ncbi:hypothetical protein SDC9_141095 [bioreactor metagenome]|uniref:Uncharacterized protein n=1 Tax=bioreactor metagenome TaxID=1076179 RepID=A0A645DZB5_9ZZZZ